MRISAALLIGTSLVALSTQAAAQTGQETAAQAANPPATSTALDQYGPDIIVTATKRASRVQEVPFSINAQTEADIQRANAKTLEDLSRNVAGLTVQNLGPGQSQVSVRGVAAGQIVRDQPGVKEQVGVYLDETVTSLSLFTPDFDLYDLNRVETLRGPQGTLFGSGSVGGTIRYITNQPKLDTFEGSAEADVNTTSGDIGYGLKGAINAPLGSTAAVRVVGYGTHFPGFIDAVGPAAGKNINDGRRYGARISALWEPTPELKITPRFVYQDVRANGFNREEFYNFYDNSFTSGAGGSDLGRRKQYLKMREEFRDKTWLGDLVASYDFGPAELTSVTSYVHRDILVSRDASALTGSVTITPFVTTFLAADPGRSLAIAPLANLTSNLRDTTKLKQWTQELRVASTGSGPFQWVFGGFYSHVNRKYAQRLPTPGYDVAGDLFLQKLCFDQAFADATCRVNDPVVANRIPFVSTDAAISNGFGPDSPYNADLPYIIKQKALFGEASYKFGQFKLTAGGRWYDFKETRDFISGGIFSNGDTRLGDKTKSNGFSPRGIISWEPNRALSVNVQVAKGFRLGGINDPLNIPICNPDDRIIYGPFTSATYDDETLWNYEAGVKYSKHGVTFNAAAFHNQIKNLQVTVDAGSCSSRLVFNVPKAHTRGVEAEFAVHPLSGLELSAAGSWVDAKFDSTIENPVLAVRTGIRDGNRLPTVPKFQFATTASYEHAAGPDMTWYGNVSLQHVGSRYTQPGDQEAGNELFNSIFFDPATNAFGTANQNFGSLKLRPYNLVNASLGVRWLNGLDIVAYVKNVFDIDPKLSLDRERGGRARLGYNVGQPRTIGLTVRKAFGGHAAVVAPPPPPPPPPPPATQTCADGTVIDAAAACPVPPPPAPPPPPPPPPPSGERG
jgi:iron complex outermembrane receptor protein